jgi:hypothetical protein
MGAERRPVDQDRDKVSGRADYGHPDEGGAMPEREDQPSVEDVEALAESDRHAREERVSDVRVVEQESGGTLQAESLAAHEDGAEVSLDDELPGGEA